MSNDLTLDEISKQTGLSTPALRNFIAGRRNPQLKGFKRAGVWFCLKSDFDRWYSVYRNPERLKHTPGRKPRKVEP